MGNKDQNQNHTKAPGVNYGAHNSYIFTIPDRSNSGPEAAASLVVVTPPFRVFCGRMKDPDTGIRHHGLWLTQRPDVHVRDVVDPRKDWLLLDFGMQLISPMWKQAQSYVEMWLLQQVGLQIAAGYRNINVLELVRQIVGPPPATT